MKKIVLFSSLLAFVAFQSCKNQSAEATTEANATATTLNGNYPVTGDLTWAGNGVGHGHTGKVNLTKGEVTFTNGALSGGSFDIDVNSLTSTDVADSAENGKLVGHLKSKDFFGTDSFPTATLKVTAVANNEATADLTIKGKTNSVKFPVTVAEDSTGAFTVSSKLTVDRTAFGIQYNSGKFFDPKKLGNYLVDDNFTLDVVLTGKK